MTCLQNNYIYILFNRTFRRCNDRMVTLVGMFAEVQINNTAQHFACINKIITQIVHVLYDKYHREK